MYKISDEVINYFKNIMKIWRVELMLRRRSLDETKVQRGINQGDALLPLLYITAMIPLNHILQKYIARYKLSKS